MRVLIVLLHCVGLVPVLVGALFWITAWNSPDAHTVVGAFLGMGLCWLGLLWAFANFYVGCAVLALGMWAGFRIAALP